MLQEFVKGFQDVYNSSFYLSGVLSANIASLQRKAQISDELLAAFMDPTRKINPTSAKKATPPAEA